MRRSQRLIASAVLITLSGVLGGCSSGLSNWDPSDLLDIFDTKKKLPGDRKPVFPDGVPGLEQGVPKELYKGASQVDQQNPQAVAAAPPPEEPKSKGTAKSKSKQPATASTAPAQDPAAAPNANAAPEEDGTAAAPPAPKPKKIVRQRTTAPPADPAAAQPDQAAQPAEPAQPAQQSASPFPAPLPGGTFTR
jgi:hypothetical protein